MQPSLTLAASSPMALATETRGAFVARLPRPSQARLAGALSLVLAICGGFCGLVVRSSIRVDGNAAASADSIRTSATLFRVDFVTDPINLACFVLLAFAVYVLLLLLPINRRVAVTCVLLMAIAAEIMGLNVLNHVGALLVATHAAYTSAFGSAEGDGLALLLDLHRHGYLIAQIFFGGWLVYRSGLFPRALGIVLMAGGASFLRDLVVINTSAGFESNLSMLVVLPAAVAGCAFLGWLLIKGARP